MWFLLSPVLYFVWFCVISTEGSSWAALSLPWNSYNPHCKNILHSHKCLGSRLLYHKTINMHHIPACLMLGFVSFVGVGVPFFFPPRLLRKASFLHSFLWPLNKISLNSVWWKRELGEASSFTQLFLSPKPMQAEHTLLSMRQHWSHKFLTIQSL